MIFFYYLFVGMRRFLEGQYFKSEVCARAYHAHIEGIQNDIPYIHGSVVENTSGRFRRALEKINNVSIYHLEKID